jgi:uncharacterized protein (TIGR02646 family)
MRQVVRRSLPKRSLNYLARKQAEINAGRDVHMTWESARRTQTMGDVARTLASMSGTRQRCMFCGDSRSTDIEHFWPKVRYPPRVFRWDNLLWICTGCNRHKGDRFRLNSRGRPLLIDPSAENPWDFLYFDSLTGNITAKYDPVTGRPSRKGAYTVDPATLPLNIEAVTEGRQRTRRNLVRAVSTFLKQVLANPHSPEAEGELLEAIRDNDDYGLSIWYFQGSGAVEMPFAQLRSAYPGVWDAIARSL